MSRRPPDHSRQGLTLMTATAAGLTAMAVALVTGPLSQPRDLMDQPLKEASICLLFLILAALVALSVVGAVCFLGSARGKKPDTGAPRSSGDSPGDS